MAEALTMAANPVAHFYEDLRPTRPSNKPSTLAKKERVFMIVVSSITIVLLVAILIVVLIVLLNGTAVASCDCNNDVGEPTIQPTIHQPTSNDVQSTQNTDSPPVKEIDSCLKDFFQINGTDSLYYIGTERTNFFDARRFCTGIKCNQGKVDLVKLDSQLEYVLVDDKVEPKHPNKQYWAGGMSLDYNGNMQAWTWAVDGSEVKQELWAPEQPDDPDPSHIENCAVIWDKDVHKTEYIGIGGLHDDSCNDQHIAMCEYFPQQAEKELKFC